MSDTPRTDELKNKLERLLLSQGTYELCSEILDGAQQIERELNETKDQLARTIEARDTLWNERFEKQEDLPRFRPGDKVWILHKGKAKEVTVDGIDYWLNHDGPGYGSVCSSEVFATKQELIESL